MFIMPDSRLEWRPCCEFFVEEDVGLFMEENFGLFIPDDVGICGTTLEWNSYFPLSHTSKVQPQICSRTTSFMFPAERADRRKRTTLI